MRKFSDFANSGRNISAHGFFPDEANIYLQLIYFLTEVTRLRDSDCNLLTQDRLKTNNINKGII